MDLADLVHAVARRVPRSPAVQCAGIGAALFAASSLLLGTGLETAERPRIVVPAYRIELARQEFTLAAGRAPSAEENRRIVDTVVEQEVLFAYALELGIDREPVAERRMAQIAQFVAENPHGHESEPELAGVARELGLHREDLVVRRILIDGTRRLIRAAMLVREPSDEMLAEYHREHAQEFRRPGELRLSHVALTRRQRGDELEADARELVASLRKKSVAPDAAAALGDHSLVPSSLPPLPPRELERRFGRRFALQLDELETGSWQGPVVSRYGLHAVWIHQRIPGRTPELPEIRKEVRARLRQALADEWLAIRLAQLRARWQIELEGGA